MQKVSERMYYRYILLKDLPVARRERLTHSMKRQMKHQKK